MQDLKQLKQLFDSAWEANDFAAALRHAIAAVRLCEGLDEGSSERRRADWNLASACIVTGDLAQAERLYLSLVETERRVRGVRHPVVANTLSELGVLYTTTGDYVRAETILCEALEIQRENRGDKHLRVAIALSALGALYIRKGNPGSAASYFEEALAVFREIGAADHLAVARLNLAEVYRSLGDLDKAGPICQQAVSDLRSVRREGDPQIALAENNLALVAFDKGEPLEARAGFYRALEEMRKGPGARHPDFPLILQNLAMTYQITGDTGRAGRFLLRALKLQFAALREEHPLTALIRINIGQALVVKPEVARPFFLRAYKSLRPAFGLANRLVALSLNGLALCFKEQEGYPQAAVLYQKSKKILSALLGDRHPEVAQILCNHAALLIAQGDLVRAASLCEEALSIYMEHGLQRHIGNLEATVLLGEACFKLHRLGEAKDHLARAMDIESEVLSPEHPLFLRTLTKLVEVYTSLEKLPEAEALLRRALDICRGSLGEDHPLFAECLEQMADLQYRVGRFAEAKKLYSRVLQIRRRCSGEIDHDVAMTLAKMAQFYLELEDHDRVEALCTQGLAIVRVVFGGYCFLSSDFSMILADSYIQRNELDRAEELMHQALEFRKERYGEKSKSVAASLGGLARIEAVRGNPREAKVLYERAINLWEELGDGESPAYLVALHNLSQVHLDLGELERAEDDIRKVVKSERFLVDRANSLNLLGLVLTCRGEYEEAESTLQGALETQISALGKLHPRCAMTLGNLAYLHYCLGQLDAAESLYRESIHILRSTEGDRHPDVVLNLLNFSILLQTRGEIREADSCLREVVEICRTVGGERSLAYAGSLANLGALQFAIGCWERAAELWSKSLEVVQAISKGHPDCASILQSLASCAQYQEQFGKAETHLRQALEIRRRHLGESHPDYLQTLGGLATLLFQQGRPAEAEPLYRQIVDGLDKVFGDRHFAYALALQNLGALLMVMGRREEGETNLRRSFEILRATVGPRHRAYQTGLLGLAFFLFDAGRADEGLEALLVVEQIQDELIEQVFGISSEAERSDYLASVRQSFEMFLSLAADAALASFDLVLRRKSLGAEALAIQSTTLLSGRHPDLEPVLRKLIEVRDQIGRKALAGAGPEGLDAHERLLAQWQKEREALEAQIARELPEIGLGESFKKAHRREIADALPSGSALVEFVFHDRLERRAGGTWGRGTSRVLVFILRAGDPERIWSIDLGDEKPIKYAFLDLRDAILRHAETRELDDEPRRSAQQEKLQQLGETLRALVFDPLLEALGDCRRLLLAPDGGLAWLSFEVLPLPGGEPLLEKYEISYLGTGRDVLRWGPSGVTPEASVVIADPDFDLAARGTQPAPETLLLGPIHELQQKARRFERLKGTRREGRRIAKRLGVSPWMGKAAREGKLKSVRSPWILHISTHGFFLRDPQKFKTMPELAKPPRSLRAGELRFGDVPRAENPLLRSGLALAGANSRLAGRPLPVDAEDGLLTAEDVTGLNLQGTEMVVLSACETGLGEPLAGEGIMGLRRSFTIAGARTLIMSLWPVPDEETQELMEDFYRRVLRGVPRAEALRQAQRAMRARPGRSHPFYWGAFICQGDPGPLSFPSSSPGSVQGDGGAV